MLNQLAIAFHAFEFESVYPIQDPLILQLISNAKWVYSTQSKVARLGLSIVNYPGLIQTADDSRHPPFIPMKTNESDLFLIYFLVAILLSS